MHKQLVGLVVLATAASLQAAIGAEPEHNPVAREPRAAQADTGLAVIVKLRVDNAATASNKLTKGADQTAALAKRTGLALSHKRDISDLMVASHIDLAGSSSTEVLTRLRSDPAVEFVSIDHQRYIQAIPSDSLFANQWYLQNTEISAVNAVNAWDQELGSAGIVVAVLDTGVLYDHPDLGRGDANGKLLPGYDFVSADFRVNDGGPRDADPSDPGDWVNDADKTANTALASCDNTGSSWHGTRVAGMIGALSNNGSGITGLSWNSYILPVRVLGKCGGSDSDILAGMRWAGGLSTPGVPANPTPARVLNMSLGATSACEQSYRTVIDELTTRKVLVVIAAGNEGTVVSSPANCPGVASVAALRHAGSKVGFSNLGPEVTLGAPGGNCVNINGGPCLFSLDTTSNTGSTVPATHSFTNQVDSNLGTSFSAPIVSGIAALMLSRNANLSTAQLLARLREGTRPFPTSVAGEPTITACHVPVDTQDIQQAQCLCTTSTCGAGMANAALSVDAAARPIAAIAGFSNVSPGQNISLNGAGSAAACGRTIVSYSWVVTDPVANPPVITNANTGGATIVAPSSGSVEVLFTVTDDQNRSDSAVAVIQPTSFTTSAPASASNGTVACAPPVLSGVTPAAPVQTPPPPPPPPVSQTPPPPSTPARRSGGGGGSFGVLALMLLGGMVAARSTRTRRAHFSRCF